MTIPPPTEPLDPVEMRWYIALWTSLADPPSVTAGQIATGLLKAGLGILLLVSRPDYMLEIAGGLPAVFIGVALLIGGTLAAFAVWRTLPGIEELGLRLAQAGLIGVFTIFTIILWDSGGRSFLVTLLAMLIGMAVLDAEKRIRRIRWDQVHPLQHA